LILAARAQNDRWLFQQRYSLAPGSQVCDSGFTAHQLGGMAKLDRDELEKTFDKGVP
jgi:hypothetical protein